MNRHSLLLPTLLALGLASAAHAQTRFGEHEGLQFQTRLGGLITETNAIATADFDGDGDLDIFLASNTGWGDAAHRVLLQDDHGAFRSTSAITTYESATSVACGDVDNDGDLDLLLGGGRTAYQGTSDADLLLNDGTGQFTTSTSIPGLHHISVGVELTDIDGDGDLDALLFDYWWSPSETVHVWQNDGSGTFTDITASAIVASPGGTSSKPLVLDVDDDLDVDFIFETTLYANDGSGNFTADPSWTPPANAFLAHDMNGDGKRDLISTSGVYRNDGGGVFTPTVTAALTGFRYGVAGDFNADGLMDIAGVREWPVQPKLWLSNGSQLVEQTAAWFPPHALQVHEIDYSHGAVAAADIDGDGDADLITGGVEGRSTSSTTVGVPPRLYLSTRTDFVDLAETPFPPVQKLLGGLAHGDIDGDGDRDLIVGATWRQQQSGTFRTDSTYISDGRPGDLADFDGDGDLDHLAVGGLDAGYPLTVPVYYGENDGNGNFINRTAINLPALPPGGLAQASGDIDGDGDLDAIVDLINHPIALLLNQGNGTFTHATSQMPSIVVDASAIELADLDRDGDLDLVATLGWWSPTAPNELVLFINDGTGTFADATASLPTIANANNLLLHDIDDDQDIDILLDGVDLQNDGVGGFTAVAAGSGRFPDLDGDGNLESVTFGGGFMSINGAAFSWGWSIECNALPVDVDDDGDIDLVTGNLGSANTAWMLFHTGILYNFQRDLQFTALPRLGQSCRISARATNGTNATIALVAVALGRLPQPVELGAWGRLHLDPALTAPLAVVTIPNNDTTVDTSLAIPANPTLLGTDLSTQALFMPLGNPDGVHLSAVQTHPLIP